MNVALADGTYYPNQPGATTLADARPLWFNGQRVSVAVSNSGTGAVIYLGLTPVYDGPLPEHVKGPADLHHWAATHPALSNAEPGHALPVDHDDSRPDTQAATTAGGKNITQASSGRGALDQNGKCDVFTGIEISHAHSRRDRAPLYTAFRFSHTIPRWSALTKISTSTLHSGIRRRGTLENYLRYKGFTAADFT